jgi:hypothetical protein
VLFASKGPLSRIFDNSRLTVITNQQIRELQAKTNSKKISESAGEILDNGPFDAKLCDCNHAGKPSGSVGMHL